MSHCVKQDIMNVLKYLKGEDGSKVEAHEDGIDDKAQAYEDGIDDQAQAYEDGIDDQAQVYEDGIDDQAQATPLNLPEVVGIDDRVYKLKGNEYIKNERLSAWIKEELKKQSVEYVTSFDQKSDHEYSRHNRSEQDFAFYEKPKGQCLNGGAIHVDYQDPEEYLENRTLTCTSGDNKNLAQDKHIFQLLANMNKTAADLGVAALKAKVLFNKIIIFGLLVGYEQKSIDRLFKLEMNFDKCSLS